MAGLNEQVEVLLGTKTKLEQLIKSVVDVTERVGEEALLNIEEVEGLLEEVGAKELQLEQELQQGRE